MFLRGEEDKITSAHETIAVFEGLNSEHAEGELLDAQRIYSVNLQNSESSNI